MRSRQLLRDRRPRNPDAAYYRKLHRDTARFKVNLSQKNWCDYWHQHFDWFNFGDRGWLDRRRHLNRLLLALRNARDELSINADQPYQLFAAVHPKSSGDDAIYVHTANPNGSKFPAEFDDGDLIDWLPPLLAGRLDRDRYTVRRMHFENESYFLIMPIESMG